MDKRSSIKLNTEYLVFGKPTAFKNLPLVLVHPEIDLWEDYNQ